MTNGIRPEQTIVFVMPVNYLRQKLGVDTWNWSNFVGVFIPSKVGNNVSKGWLIGTATTIVFDAWKLGERSMEKQLEASLQTAISFLEAGNYRYALIGGIALSQSKSK